VRFPEVMLCFPGWVDSCLSDPDEMYPTVEDRMRLVVGSRSNMDHRTGGPFEAAIFDLHTIVIAQLVVGDFILGGEGQPPHELVTSAEPCARRHLLVGRPPPRLRCLRRRRPRHRLRRRAETSRLGRGELERRGTAVVRDKLRDEAAAVLLRYAEEGGVIYNGRQGGQA
jgi:hypothetical protein